MSNIVECGFFAKHSGVDMNLKLFMFLILLIATFLMLNVSYLSYRRRQQPIARYCSLVMLACSFYSFGYAFEILSESLEQIKLWLSIEYIGIPYITTLWLIIVIHYTGHQQLLKKRLVACLFSIPLITFILFQTNDLHHLFYARLQFDPNPGYLAGTRIAIGPWYWVHMGYIYLQAAAGMALFIWMYMKSMPIVRKQVMVMLLGAAAPWGANILYLAFFRELNLDLTPLGFTMSGLVYLWGIYRLHMYRLIPVAMQSAFEEMQDGVVIMDYESRITQVNQAAGRILQACYPGNSNDEPVHVVFARFPYLLEKLNADESGEVQLKLEQKDGIRYYLVKLSSIYDKDQLKLGNMLMFSDVTQVMNYQEKLHAKASQLAELNAFKDKLFTVVAHDIRDPLAMLVNLTELIEEDFAGNDSEEFAVFHELSDQVRDTYRLVENLLDWFRSQRGQMNAMPENWQPASLIESSIEALKSRILHKKIQIDIHIEEDISVYADQGMALLVLRNLLSNAVKFSSNGGHIRIEAASGADVVTLTVRDDGQGVDPEIGATLFHEVQQSKQGTQDEKGTGLGLYLCAKFVELNGGSIWFESEPGRGSTFSFTLPANETVSMELRAAKERNHS